MFDPLRHTAREQFLERTFYKLFFIFFFFLGSTLQHEGVPYRLIILLQKTFPQDTSTCT